MIAATLRSPRWLLLLAGLWVATPSLTSPATRLLATPGSEAYGHLWVQWLLRRAVLEGTNPFHHQVVKGEGWWLFPTDLAPRAVGAALGGVIGDVAAYNLVLIGLLLLLGISVDMLARALGARPWPAMFAAMVAMLHPATQGFLASGRSDSLTAGIAVLGTALLVRWWQAPSLRHALQTGLCWGVLPAFSPNLTYLALFVLPPLLLLRVLRAPRPPLRLLSLGLLPGAILAAALAGGFLWVDHLGDNRLGGGRPPGAPLIERLDAEAYRGTEDHLSRQMARAIQGDRRSGSWHALDPAVMELLADRDWGRTPLTPRTNVGAWWWLAVVPLAIGLVGVARRQRTGAILALLAVALACQLLALGDGPVHAAPLPIPATDELLVLRPATLFRILPMGAAFENFGLFGMLAAIAAGLAAALSLSGLGRAVLLATLVGAAAWGLELQLLGPAPLPTGATDMRTSLELDQALARCGREGVSVFPAGAEF